MALNVHDINGWDVQPSVQTAWQYPNSNFNFLMLHKLVIDVFT